jgi:hypothetical protein
MLYLPPRCAQGGLRKRLARCPLLHVLKIKQLKLVVVNLRLVPNIVHELEVRILALIAVPWGEVGLP